MEERINSHPDRRSFIRSVGAASLSLAAAGLPGLSRAAENAPSGLKARLDPQAPLRIGMIGTEGHTDMVLREVGKVPGARIAAYAFEDGDWEFNVDGGRRGAGAYDLDRQRKWAAGQPWCRPDTKIYETYQEMLDKEKLDLAVVCLPYVRNAYAVAASAKAGLQVLSEKPVAVNYADLEMADKAVKSSGVRLSALFAMRYGQSYFTIKHAVEKGLIGKPCLGRGQKSYKWGEERPWFYKNREIYGSSILWVGIHAIDYIRWPMGLEVTKVSAMQGNLAHPDYPGAQDHAVVNMLFDSGATGAVTLDYLRPESATTHGDDRLRVIGTKGVVEKKELDETVELITAGEGPKKLALDQPPSLFADFVGELRGQGTHLIGPDEAVRVTRICIAAPQAAEEGRTVEV